MKILFSITVLSGALSYKVPEQDLSYKVPERSEWERGPAPLSSLLPRLEPAGEILLLLKQNVEEEREQEGEVKSQLW
jgi:hypothetical protein